MEEGSVDCAGKLSFHGCGGGGVSGGGHGVCAGGRVVRGGGS